MTKKNKERIEFLERAMEAIKPFLKFNISVAEASLQMRGKNQLALLPQLLLVCDAHNIKQFTELNEFLSERKAEIHRSEMKAV